MSAIPYNLLDLLVDKENKNLDDLLIEAVRMAEAECRPQLHVFTISYSPGNGWVCMIQESQLTAVSIGGHLSSPIGAIQKALEVKGEDHGKATD